MAVAADQSTAPLVPEHAELLSLVNERRSQARSERRKYEPTWMLCKSFIAGRQWVGINPRTGRVITDTRFERRERHTVNVIGQYLQTVLGKLFVEDLRPDVVFRREDIESQTIAEHTHSVAKYLWDTELDAEQRLLHMLHKLIGYGTAGMRCLFDPSQGSVVGQMPIGADGMPMMADAHAAVAEASMMGQQLEIRDVKEGRIIWEPLGPSMILPPPGIADPEWFPWLIIERTMPVSWAEMRFPNAAGEIRAQDVASLDSLDQREMPSDSADGYVSQGRLKDHCVVSTMYEMPTNDYPEGRVVIWSNNTLLDLQDKLPYRLRGKPHHGVVFFRYHMVPDRFWGIGLVEPLIGPQRQKNRARSQMIEMKDRNLGRVYARKGTITAANKPVGKIMELIEIPLHVDYPQETTGIPPGPWVENESRMNDEDMDRVAGLREVSLGTSPPGVQAYSAMALLSEQDERRVGPVLKQVRQGIGDAMLLTLDLVKRYWMNGKQLAVAGQDGTVNMMNFQRAQLPLDFYIDVTKNAPLPTSPAVEAQKIFDLFNAATSAGQPLPVDWLKDSLDQGRALPLPKREEQVQIGKAEQENLMISQGVPVVPAYYDDDFLHVQIHRHQQTEWAQTMGMDPLVQAIEMHIQMHVQNAAMKKPMAGGGNVPAQQGARGAEAQNGPHVDQAAAAQRQSMGGAPEPARGMGPVPRTNT